MRDKQGTNKNGLRKGKQIFSTKKETKWKHNTLWETSHPWPSFGGIWRGQQAVSFKFSIVYTCNFSCNTGIVAHNKGKWKKDFNYKAIDIGFYLLHRDACKPRRVLPVQVVSTFHLHWCIFAPGQITMIGTGIGIQVKPQYWFPKIKICGEWHNCHWLHWIDQSSHT